MGKIPNEIAKQISRIFSKTFWANIYSCKDLSDLLWVGTLTSELVPVSWVWWHIPVVTVLERPKQKDHLDSRGQDQPNQHSETCLKNITPKTKENPSFLESED